MAPRKDKIEKASGDAAVDLILNYLRTQNRPYSATDISANLHNKVSKVAAAKLLKEMHENKQIEGRASGKQLVYHALQDPNESTTQEDLGRIDAQIVAIREENASTTATIKELRSQLSLLNSTVSTADLRTSVEKMEAEKEAITARLIMLKTGDVKPVRKEEKEAIDEDMRKWERIARNRSKIIKDMWGSVLDALPEGVNAADLREELGIDD